jgi:hypothetical protein
MRLSSSRISLSLSGSWTKSRGPKDQQRGFRLAGCDDIKARIYGDTAIVTYRSTAKGKDQDGSIEQRRWTRVCS